MEQSVCNSLPAQRRQTRPVMTLDTITSSQGYLRNSWFKYCLPLHLPLNIKFALVIVSLLGHIVNSGAAESMLGDPWSVIVGHHSQLLSMVTPPKCPQKAIVSLLINNLINPGSRPLLGLLGNQSLRIARSQNCKLDQVVTTCAK